MIKNIDNLIKRNLPEAIEARHYLHQIPELKYEEFKTSAFIAEKLKSFGCDVSTGIGKTGIVALIDSGKPGKTVALRADMDALPIQEATNIYYRSVHEGRMHACGHDGHSATLLTVAWLLQQMKDQFIGKIKLIFQPAEEGGKGSLAMIQDGVLESPKVDAIFGYHNWPGLAEGKVGVRVGGILAGNGRIEITIHGKIAHTAMPQNAINPVTIGAKLITSLDSFRNKYNSNAAIINVTHFQGGNPSGAMSDQAKIIALYYVEDEALLSKIKSDVQVMSEQISKEYHAIIKSDFFEWHSPTINTPVETELLLNIAHSYLPSEDVIELNSCKMAAEDFSEYLKRVPGCFFLIGAGETAAPVHTTEFDFPDKIIPIAAKLLCLTAINFCNNAS